MRKRWIFEGIVLVISTIALEIVIFNNLVGATNFLLNNSIYIIQMIVAIIFSAIFTFTKFMKGKDLFE